MAGQAFVDRARAQAQNCMRRAKAGLDKLQATRRTRTILQNEANSDFCSPQGEALLQEGAVLQNEANPVEQPKSIVLPQEPRQGRAHHAISPGPVDPAWPPPCAVSFTFTPSLRPTRPARNQRKQLSE